MEINQPANEDANDEVTDQPEVFTRLVYEIPETSLEAELGRKKTQRLQSADQERNDDRYERHRQIAIELADGLERPVTGLHHQHAINAAEFASVSEAIILTSRRAGAMSDRRSAEFLFVGMAIARPTLVSSTPLAG
jgi:hypothetical protein